jgi:hypothetical protein
MSTRVVSKKPKILQRRNRELILTASHFNLLKYIPVKMFTFGPPKGIGFEQLLIVQRIKGTFGCSYLPFFSKKIEK